MALILGVENGMRFYVEDTPVDCIVHGDAIILVAGTTRVKLTELQRVKLFPDVYVSLGRPPLKAQEQFAQKKQAIQKKILDKIPLTDWEKSFPSRLLPRIVIEAPRHIRILRDKLYHNPPKAVRLVPAA